MPSLQSYGGTFTCPGAGDLTPQVISGITDKLGNAFTPKVVIFFGMNAGYIDSANNQIWNSFGVDDGINAVAQGNTSQATLGTFWSTYTSTANASLVQNVSVFFANQIVTGRITALASGSFTYTLSLNTYGNAVFNYLALGGDDLLVKIGTTNIPSPTTAITGIGFPVMGLITFGIASATGASPSGGSPPNIGFVGSNLTQVSASAAIGEGATGRAYSYQRTNKALVSTDLPISGTPPAQGVDIAVVNSLDPDGFTITRTGPVYGLGYLAFGGLGVHVGSFNQSAADSTQTIPFPDETPQFILMMSVGGASSSTVQTNHHFSTGMYDGRQQRSYWEGAVNGVTANGAGPGGNYGQFTTNCLYLGTPVNGTSSSNQPNGTLVATGLNAGTFTGNWTNCDGVLREVLYLVMTTPEEPPPQAIYSGIYQMVPGKTHDELYLTFDPVSTQNVKIP